MVELRQFRQFVAVAEEMSFRRAAERLRMAQPPLTTAVKRIEAQLGVILLERSSRVVRLTEPGRVFLEEARKTIAQADRTLGSTRRAAEGLVGSLRVTFVPTLAHDLLPRILRAFRQNYPEIHLDLGEAPTGPQTEAVINDQADFGLIVPPITESAGLVVETLFRDRLVAAIPKDHALASRPKIALADLKAEPWILCPARQAPGFCARITTACAQAGFVPQVTQHAVQMDTILGLIAGHLGVGLVPGLLVKPREGIVFKRLTGAGTPVAYEIAGVRRAGEMKAPLVAFLKTTRTIMKNAARKQQ